MFERIYRKLLDQTGAMDKIIVTLLFVLIGVAAVIGLYTWATTQEEGLKTEAATKITQAKDEAISD